MVADLTDLERALLDRIAPGVVPHLDQPRSTTLAAFRDVSFEEIPALVPKPLRLFGGLFILDAIRSGGDPFKGFGATFMIDNARQLVIRIHPFDSEGLGRLAGYWQIERVGDEFHLYPILFSQTATA